MSIENVRRYYTDSYVYSFEAEVIERIAIEGRSAVVLSHTYLYPESGGQPADRGEVAGFKVLDVQFRESDGAIVHYLDAQESPTGTVLCTIDAARRQDYMRHHSAQHVLSQALLIAAHAETVSVHFGDESRTIDLGRVDITDAEWAAAELLANQVVLRDGPVRAWFPSTHELAGLPLRRPPKVSENVRIIDIAGFDLSACGGTHVRRSGEIGLIKIVGHERRGSTTRLEFRCGEAALDDYRLRLDALHQSGTLLSASGRKIPEAIARLLAEKDALQLALASARRRLLDFEAAEIVASASASASASPKIPSHHAIVQVYADRDPSELRDLASRIVEQPGQLVVLALAGTKVTLVCARSVDRKEDMRAVLQAICARLGGGRGGGRPEFAQGGGFHGTKPELESAISEVIDRL